MTLASECWTSELGAGWFSFEMRSSTRAKTAVRDNPLQPIENTSGTPRVTFITIREPQAHRDSQVFHDSACIACYRKWAPREPARPDSRRNASTRINAPILEITAPLTDSLTISSLSDGTTWEPGQIDLSGAIRWRRGVFELPEMAIAPMFASSGEAPSDDPYRLRQGTVHRARSALPSPKAPARTLPYRAGVRGSRADPECGGGPACHWSRAVTETSLADCGARTRAWTPHAFACAANRIVMLPLVH
jgi:hypothetical protein